MDELTRLIEQALLEGARMDLEFNAQGKHWILSMKPIEEAQQ